MNQLSTHRKHKGLNIELTGGPDRVIDCNDKICVVPWHVTGGGALAAFHVDNASSEVQSKQTLHLLQAHKSPLTSFALCDLDSSLLATTARDAVIKVRLARKSLCRNFDEKCAPPLSREICECLSSVKRFFISMCFFHARCNKLWRITNNSFEGHNGVPMSEITMKAKRIDSLLFHPTAASIMAATGDNNEIAIIDTSTGQVAIELRGATDRISACAW